MDFHTVACIGIFFSKGYQNATYFKKQYPLIKKTMWTNVMLIPQPADESAPAEQPVPSEGESEAPSAAEDTSDTAAATSNTHV